MSVLDRLESWLSDSDEHRLRIQDSLSPGEFLVVLEIGPQGHGVSAFYGKHDTALGAIQGALEAFDREAL